MKDNDGILFAGTVGDFLDAIGAPKNPVRFSDLDENGVETNVREIPRESIRKCPTFIFWADHYRADGSCRHDETNCEWNGCTELKFEDEIFCEKHLEQF